MKSGVFILSLLAATAVWADTLTRNDGATASGSFQGFADRQILFKDEDGNPIRAYLVDVQSLVLDAPIKANVETITRQYDAVVFHKLDHNMLRLRKDGSLASEPVYMLKRLDVLGPVTPAPATEPAAVDPAGVPRAVAPSRQPAVRDWKRAGKWRELDDDKSIIISHGEEIDIEASLHKGVVNVVHFHYPQAMASTRQGNYIQGIMTRHANRMVVLKIVTPDFNAPICNALKLKSLPQFWFYSPDGRLVKKLVDRFTESDIDAALKEASRN